MTPALKPLCAALLCLLSAGAQASLVGRTVECTTTGKWALIFECDAASATVQSPGPEFDLIWDFIYPAFRIDIDAQSIRIDMITYNFNWPLGQQGSAAVTLEGLDVGDGRVISGATVHSGAVPNVQAGNVQFGPDTVTFDFSGTGMWTQGSWVQVDLATAPIPEPAVWSLAGLALAGLGAARRVAAQRHCSAKNPAT